MKKIATFGLTGLSLLAAVALIAPAAGAAAGTTIRADSATGAAYSGNVRGTLISSAVRFASSGAMPPATGRR
ncbi:hypothetical protein ACRAKI_23430 [Saccharothrix isguenensis]